MSETRMGVLKTWGRRGYGLVTVRYPDNHLEHFFLHITNVAFSELDEPEVGCPVKFTIGESRVPGKYPNCEQAYIYAPLVSTATASAVTAALSGKLQSEPKEGR